MAAAAGMPPSAKEYAFLVKRAAVVLTGADPDAMVVSEPLPADPVWLGELYGQEVAAYLDGLAFRAGDAALDDALAAVTELDPGKPLVLEGLAAAFARRARAGRGGTRRGARLRA